MGLPVGVIVIGCAARTVAVGPAGAAVAAFAVVPLLDCDAAEGVVDKLAVSDRNIAENGGGVGCGRKAFDQDAAGALGAIEAVVVADAGIAHAGIADPGHNAGNIMYADIVDVEALQARNIAACNVYAAVVAELFTLAVIAGGHIAGGVCVAGNHLAAVHGVGNVQIADLPVFLIVQVQGIVDLAVGGDAGHMFGFVAVGADCDVGIGAAAALGLQRGVLPLAAALKQDLVAGNIGVLIHAGDGFPCGLFGFAVFAVVAVGADVVSGSCGVRRKGVGVAGSYGNGLDVECAAVPAVGVELDFLQIVGGGACLGVAQRHHAVYGYTEGIALHINVHADGLPCVGGQRSGIGCVFAVHMGLVLGGAVVGEQAVCNRAAVVEDIGNAVLVGIAVLVQLHLGGDGDIAGIALGDVQAIVNQSSLAAVRGAAHLEYLPHFGIGDKFGSAAAVRVSPAVHLGVIVQVCDLRKVDGGGVLDCGSFRLGGGGILGGAQCGRDGGNVVFLDCRKVGVRAAAVCTGYTCAGCIIEGIRVLHVRVGGIQPACVDVGHGHAQLLADSQLHFTQIFLHGGFARTQLVDGHINQLGVWIFLLQLLDGSAERPGKGGFIRRSCVADLNVGVLGKILGVVRAAVKNDVIRGRVAGILNLRQDAAAGVVRIHDGCAVDSVLLQNGHALFFSHEIDKAGSRILVAGHDAVAEGHNGFAGQRELARIVGAVELEVIYRLRGRCAAIVAAAYHFGQIVGGDGSIGYVDNFRAIAVSDFQL